MYIMEINDGETIIKCDDYSYGFYGTVTNIVISVKELPIILNDAYLTGSIIDKIILYDEALSKCKKYSVAFLKVKITGIIDNKSYCTVSMQSSDYTSPTTNIIKFCLEPGCSYKIDYSLIMIGLLEMSIDEKTAEKIWKSSYTEFFCCTHFHDILPLILGS